MIAPELQLWTPGTMKASSTIQRRAVAGQVPREAPRGEYCPATPRNGYPALPRACGSRAEDASCLIMPVNAETPDSVAVGHRGGEEQRGTSRNNAAHSSGEREIATLTTASGFLISAGSASTTPRLEHSRQRIGALISLCSQNPRK